MNFHLQTFYNCHNCNNKTICACVCYYVFELPARSSHFSQFMFISVILPTPQFTSFRSIIYKYIYYIHFINNLDLEEKQREEWENSEQKLMNKKMQQQNLNGPAIEKNVVFIRIYGVATSKYAPNWVFARVCNLKKVNTFPIFHFLLA